MPQAACTGVAARSRAPQEWVLQDCVLAVQAQAPCWWGVQRCGTALAGNAGTIVGVPGTCLLETGMALHMCAGMGIMPMRVLRHATDLAVHVCGGCM